ncbi:MAG: HAD-IIIA family hydrolase, partial [Chloroflexota bacterium]
MNVQAVLLDRDGTINLCRDDYVKSTAEFEFLPGAREAIASISAAGIRVIVVTNQSMIGRGIATAAQLDEIHRLMRS